MDEHTETAEAQEQPVDNTPVATQLANLLKRFKAETNEYERTCAKMAHPVSPAEQVTATKRVWLRELTALLPAIQELQRDATPHRPADAAAAGKAGEPTTLQSLWHQYRDDEHAEHFTDDEWAEYKKFFKRGVNFPDWLRAHGVDPSLPAATPEPVGEPQDAAVNNDKAWIRRMAEKEDGKIVSVGGWVHDIEKAEAQTPPADAPGGGAGEPGAVMMDRDELRGGLRKPIETYTHEELILEVLALREWIVELRAALVEGRSAYGTAARVYGFKTD